MATGTVTLSADNTSVLSGQKVNFQVVIANTGGAQATVQSVQLIGPLSGWYNMQSPQVPIGGTIIAATTGTATFLGSGSFYQNQNQDLNIPFPQYQQFSVSANVNFSDGTSLSSGSLTISASPITTPPTAMPGPGQARHESNLESGLTALFL